jgi:hypothetical protein
MSFLLTAVIVLYIQPFPIRSFIIEQDFHKIVGTTKSGKEFSCVEAGELAGEKSSITAKEIMMDMNRRIEVLRFIFSQVEFFSGIIKFIPYTEISEFQYCVNFSSKPNIIGTKDRPFLTVILPDGEALSPNSKMCKQISEKNAASADLCSSTGSIKFEMYYCTKDINPYFIYYKNTTHSTIKVTIQPFHWIAITIILFVESFCFIFIVLSVVGLAYHHLANKSKT